MGPKLNKLVIDLVEANKKLSQERDEYKLHLIFVMDFFEHEGTKEQYQSILSLLRKHGERDARKSPDDKADEYAKRRYMELDVPVYHRIEDDFLAGYLAASIAWFTDKRQPLPLPL